MCKCGVAVDAFLVVMVMAFYLSVVMHDDDDGEDNDSPLISAVFLLSLQ